MIDSTDNELTKNVKAYIESQQFAVDMRKIEERAEELAKDIKAMRWILMAAHD
jgi:hypothetical protein